MLDFGVLSKQEREEKTTRQTVRKYVDASGKQRFVGTADLSASQKLGPHYANFILILFRVWGIYDVTHQQKIKLEIQTMLRPSQGLIQMNSDAIYAQPGSTTSAQGLVLAEGICDSNPNSTDGLMRWNNLLIFPWVTFGRKQTFYLQLHI